MRLVILAAFGLAACGGPAAPVVSDETPGAPTKSAETAEAEKVCAEITGYRLDRPEGGESATDKLRAEEFRSCLSAVTTRETPGLPEATGEPH